MSGAVGTLHCNRKDYRFYEDMLDRLKASESVYPCTCTRADIERAASAPHARRRRANLSRHLCRTVRAVDARALGDRPFAWRFRVPQGLIDWDDLFLGPHRAGPIANRR